MISMNTRTIVEYILAAIIVLILGSLAGWYFFLRTQNDTTASQSAARGFGSTVPLGNADGSARSFSPGTTDSSAAQSAEALPRPPQLWQVEGKAVAGQIFIGSGSTLRLRYVERGSGYVFEADPETGRVVRLSNTLLPKIYEALLSENGHIYERSLDGGGAITTFVGTIATSTDATSTTSQTLLGSYLAKNISNMSVHSTSGGLFYLVQNGLGTTGTSAEWNGNKQKTIFSSTIIHWQPSILEDGRIILSQAAADTMPGYAYELKSDGSLTTLLGPIAGLVALVRSTSGASASHALLWSQSVRGSLSLFVRPDQNASSVTLPIKTLADKCVWARTGDPIAYCGVPQGSIGQNFLDEWYRGAAHSSDALWRIDARGGSAEQVYTPPSNTPIDVDDMVIDKSGNYLAFKNAADGSLWIMRLTK